MSGPPVADLEKLRNLVSEGTLDAAIRSFCRDHGCSGAARGVHWTLLLSLPDAGRVLEIGPGFGEDTLRLVQAAARPVVLAPRLENALLVRERLRRELDVSVPIAVAPALARLPFPDGSMDAIAMDEAGAAGFGVDSRSLPAIASEWRRVLAPGGTVVLGWPNGWAGSIGRTPAPEPLNRYVKRMVAVPSVTCPGLARVLRIMKRSGFGRPAIHAPLPDETHAEALVPLDDRQALRYFVSHLVRQNSPVVRLALRFAGPAAALGLLQRVVPYCYLTFPRDRVTSS